MVDIENKSTISADIWLREKRFISEPLDWDIKTKNSLEIGQNWINAGLNFQKRGYAVKPLRFD